jgi:hypothetical protein
LYKATNRANIVVMKLKINMLALTLTLPVDGSGMLHCFVS